ncbi:MAG TPA: YjbH domain-containing protein, partial [Gemmatimonadaceae bacterium]|nr:YjbH domain-containing protein [Gemmatimonadaceae bacterium]
MPGIGRLGRIPVATPMPLGVTDLRYDILRDPEVLGYTHRQENVTFSVGFLPRLTLTARGTIAKDSLTGEDLTRDLSAGASLQLVTERGWRPAIAAGMQDVGGKASNFRTAYVVADRTLFGRARITAGYGDGPDVLKGVFGGVQLTVWPALSVFAEHDTKALNAGVRVLPFPERWIARGVPRPSVDFLWQQDHGASVALGVRTGL